MPEEAPLLNEEADHPHEIVQTTERGRIIAMDSMRYVDARNGRDVVVAASYLGVLPARLAAPHTPRAVIGHDGCVGKDGAGISGLGYLEALGIPAATGAGMTAELGNGLDLYEYGRISYMNILAERLGVTEGMPVHEAARLLLDGDVDDTEPGTRIRREVMEEFDGRQVVVTDSIVFALPEDHGTNVLVTAGHTGRSGASFVQEVMPWGFISADGGRGKNDSGISGLQTTEDLGIPGATFDVFTAPIGDAFKAYADGRISALNSHAQARGVSIGQTVRDAAHCLLISAAKSTGQSSTRVKSSSLVLDRGELAALSPTVAEGYARVRDIIDTDGALSAATKALFVAAVAAAHDGGSMVLRELGRAHRLGLTYIEARGATLALLAARGEPTYDRFARAVDEVFGENPPRSAQIGGTLSDAQSSRYLHDVGGVSDEALAFLGRHHGDALGGISAMYEWTATENPLGPVTTALLWCVLDAARRAPGAAARHAANARDGGAEEAQLVEALFCAVPVVGIAAAVITAEGLVEGAS